MIRALSLALLAAAPVGSIEQHRWHRCVEDVCQAPDEAPDAGALVPAERECGISCRAGRELAEGPPADGATVADWVVAGAMVVSVVIAAISLGYQIKAAH